MKLLGSDSRSRQKAVALEFTQSPRFVKGWSDLNYAEAFAQV